MIGASKILTVSYGTFSCTLEGFDEPFNTMKAIAEYFRDLAAEDRYFGAEPPTPDAAMLHKIAEREIHRRVEAKIQENGVILRAGDALDAPAPAAHVTAAPALIDQDDQPLLYDASAVTDSVAVKLSRLRASAAAAVTPVALPSVAADTYDEDQHADDLMIRALSKDVQSTAANNAATSNQLIADQAVIAEYDDQHAEASDTTKDEFATIGLAAETIGDLVAEPAGFSDYLIDESDEKEYTANQPSANDDPNDIFDQDAQDDLARLDAPEYTDDDEFELIAPTNQMRDAGDQGEVSFEQPTVVDTLAADDALLSALGSMIDKNDQSDRVNLDDDFEDEFEGLDDDFAFDAGLPGAPLPSQMDASADDADANDANDAQSTAAFPALPEGIQRARARVIKIRRADVPALPPQTNLLSDEAEAALQAELAALEAETPYAEPQPTAADSDADFEAELASISAGHAVAPVRPNRAVRSINVVKVSVETVDVIGGIAQDRASVTVQETISSQDVTLGSATKDDAADLRHDIEGDLADEAVGRLMLQTNSALDGEDVKRRQSAIAHLKAAVAATEADRQIAPVQPKDDLTESYRNDLESVVRPMRPSSGDQRGANNDRPQPLVLVSAQRIVRLPRSETAPRPENAPRIVAPVRPRRIATSALATMQQGSLLVAQDDSLDDDEGTDDAAVNMFAETESFADFADRINASALPDLLEAAAVYCASVLGRPEFSRPLVLRQIATLPATADLSREDGLRVFGTLLRQGRITKTRRGQFAVTDRSPILAEALRTAS